MRYKLFLPGITKSGKNGIQINPKTFAHYPKKSFVDWRNAMFKAIALQKDTLPAAPITEEVHVSIWYSKGDNVRRDMPGIMDAIWHVLERSGILADDTQVKSLTWSPVRNDVAGVWLAIDYAGYADMGPWAPSALVLACVAPKSKRAVPRSRAQASLAARPSRTPRKVS